MNLELIPPNASLATLNLGGTPTPAPRDTSTWPAGMKCLVKSYPKITI